jgi:hypothetical protein
LLIIFEILFLKFGIPDLYIDIPEKKVVPDADIFPFKISSNRMENPH